MSLFAVSLILGAALIHIKVTFYERWYKCDLSHSSRAVPPLVLGLAYATLGQLPSFWGVVRVACVALGIMLLAVFARAVDTRGILLAPLTSA